MHHMAVCMPLYVISRPAIAGASISADRSMARMREFMPLRRLVSCPHIVFVHSRSTDMEIPKLPMPLQAPAIEYVNKYVHREGKPTMPMIAETHNDTYKLHLCCL